MSPQDSYKDDCVILKEPKSGKLHCTTHNCWLFYIYERDGQPQQLVCADYENLYSHYPPKRQEGSG